MGFFLATEAIEDPPHILLAAAQRDEAVDYSCAASALRE